MSKTQFYIHCRWCFLRVFRGSGTAPKHLFSAFVLAIALAACAKSPKVEPLATAVTVPIDQAFAAPPPGGPAIVGIVETAFLNGKQQDIALATHGATPGQNLLRVQIIGVTSNSIENGSSLSEEIPTQEAISKEHATFLPGVHLKQSPYLLQNQYGPFSYAAGRSSAGETCLYAWQQIGKPQSRKTIFSPRGAIQIRLRLCDPALDERALLEKMYRLSINVAVLDPSWGPYGEPLRPPADWGRTSSPIVPLSSEGFVGVVPSRKVPARGRPRQAQSATPISAATKTPTTIVPSPVTSTDKASEGALDVIVPPPPPALLNSGTVAKADTTETVSKTE